MNRDGRELVEIAKTLGFVPDRNESGSGHLRLVHSNGVYVTASTPSDWRARKNAIAELERISGQKLPRVNRGRSRKAFKPSGFSTDLAVRESSSWHRDHDAEVHDLVEKRDALIADCRRFAQTRDRLREIPPLLMQITDLEDQLRLLCNPVEPFDPYSLATQESA